MSETGQATYPGRNRVSPRALTTLTQAIAANALGVRPADVRTNFSDDGGALAISLATPIGSVGLARVPSHGQEPLMQQCIRAKTVVSAELSRLTGATVARVDIRLTSVRFPSRQAAMDKRAPEPTKRRVM